MDKSLSVYDFGRELVRTKDLDPVYVVLHEVQWDRPKLERWLLAYFCFYHVGTASWIADETDYWDAMTRAAGSKGWPRSSERRHFRGQQALNSVAYLQSRGVDSLFAPFHVNRRTAKQVMKDVREWRGFGQWISFKAADIFERLGMLKVEFSVDSVMYDSPQKAAELLWTLETGITTGAPDDVGPWAINRILSKIGTMLAPPRYERTLNAQEAETVLCKWKSYMNGHYHIGEDIDAIFQGLRKFPTSPSCVQLLAAGRKGKLWG